MSNEVKIAFKNYKLLKDGEMNLSNGSIFFAQGPNNVGKTSFLNLIQAIMEVKDETVNPVTFGEQTGFSTGSIPGADGRIYQYRYDFNVDGKAKFQFIDEDNKVIKSVGEMRAIFNYTHFTMEEFFDWSKTVPGRKKQREIFMNLLSEKERIDILEIEQKVDATNGEFVASRRALNTEIDFLKKKVDTSILTLEEKTLLKQKDEIISTVAELETTKETIEKLINGVSGTVERRKSITEQLTQLKDANTEYVTNHNKQIDDIDAQILALEKKRKENEEALSNVVSIYDEKKTNLETELKTLNESGSISVEEIDAKTAELTTITERIKKGKEYKDAILVLETKVGNVDFEKEQLEIKTKQANDFDAKITTLREKKKDIIKNSQYIPLGWSLGDDCVTINGIPFMETDLSKSQATKAIAELMMRINKAPVMLMGDAEALGYEVLDELLATAKETGKIMIFAEHVRTANELQLVCYDDLVHESQEKKALF